MGTGISAISSKLRTMSNLTIVKVKGQQQSVVHYDPDSGEIDWPVNPNSSGVLCVPRPCKTIAEWQARVDNNS